LPETCPTQSEGDLRHLGGGLPPARLPADRVETGPAARL